MRRPQGAMTRPIARKSARSACSWSSRRTTSGATRMKARSAVADRMEYFRPFQAAFDGSVLTPAPGEAAPAAAVLALSWMEREAHKARIVIPPRFRALEDDPEATAVRRRLAQALDRFRPAGVAIEVGFVDEGWVLGTGVLGPPGGSAVAALVGGMALWPAPPDDGGG